VHAGLARALRLTRSGTDSTFLRLPWW